MQMDRPSARAVEIALKLQEGSVLAREVRCLQELLAGLPEGWTPADEAHRLALAAASTRELLELRDMRRRTEEAHAKAVDAVRQLESWRAVKDERARTVLHSKWGSARFYRDKLAHILGK